MDEVDHIIELIQAGDAAAAIVRIVPSLSNENLVLQLLGYCAHHNAIEVATWLLANATQLTRKPLSFAPELTVGDQLLGVACRFGSLEVVCLLVETYGVRVDTSFNGAEQVPLMDACHSGNVEVVAYLLKRGANPNEFRPAAVSFPLLLAAHAGNFLLVKVLVEHGAAVNGLNPFGLSPLSYALMNGDQETINYLRSVGALEPWQIRGEAGPSVPAATW